MARKAQMSDDRLNEWNARLTFAHKYWEAKGLSLDADSEDSAARFIRYYRGDQWPQMGWGNIPREQCITVNVTLSNTNIMKSRLSKRYPLPVVTPTRRSGDESARARRVEIVLKYFSKELKMKRQVDRALNDALLGPFGIVQHFYMPHIEKYDKDGAEIETYSQARPNLPGIRRRPWWDVRIDPLAETFEPDGTARWVGFRDLLTMDQVKAHPRLTVRDDLRPTKSADLSKNYATREYLLGQDPDWSQLVECWWIYDKADRSFFCLSPGSRRPLMEPDDWPIPWEALPYSYIAFNEQVDSNVPLPFPQSYADQQLELNKTRTLMAELVKRLRRLVFAQRGAFTEADQRRFEAGDLGLMEFFLADGDLASAISQIQIGGFPQELLLYDAKIREDIREAIGLSQMDRAQRVNVQSATEAQQIQQGSDSQTSGPVEAFEDFWADVLRRFYQTLRYTLTEDLLVPITGTADAAALQAEGEFVQISPEQIQGEFNVNIRAGSTLPEDHDRIFAKALQLKTILKDDATANQHELTQILIEEAGFDAKRVGMTPDAVVQTQQELQNQGLGGGQGGGGTKRNAPGNTGGVDANLMRMLRPGAGGGP